MRELGGRLEVESAQHGTLILALVSVDIACQKIGNQSIGDCRRDWGPHAHARRGPSIQLLGGAGSPSEEVGDYRNNRQNQQKVNQAR